MHRTLVGLSVLEVLRGMLQTPTCQLGGFRMSSGQNAGGQPIRWLSPQAACERSRCCRFEREALGEQRVGLRDSRPPNEALRWDQTTLNGDQLLHPGAARLWRQAHPDAM